MDREQTKYVPKEKRKQTNQYITAVVVNIFAFGHGSMTGWASPMLPLLKSQTPPNGIPQFDVDDITWTSSLLILSSLVTTPIFSYTLDKIGRKNTAYIMTILCIISWLLIIFADSVLMILIARVFSGLAGGGTRILCPTYVSDIAEDNIKGKLGVLFSTYFNAGLLFSFVIGSYTSYTITGYLSILIPVIFSVLLFFLPESPIYLLMKGKELEARKAMTWFRNGTVNEDEIARLTVRANEALKRKKSKVSFMTLRKRASFRTLLIGVFLMLNIQFSGGLAILNYTVIIFEESGSDMSPNLSAIIVGALLAFGAYLATFVIERVGRKPLLIIGNIFVTVALGTLGIYFYMRRINYDVGYLWWLPVTCLSGYIVAVACGLQSPAYSMLAEITSPEDRRIVSGTCGFIVCLAGFVVNKSFLYMSNFLGMNGLCWFYAAYCTLSAVIVFATIPETKNRSLEDIQEQLVSDKYIASVMHGYKKFSYMTVKTLITN